MKRIDHFHDFFNWHILLNPEIFTEMIDSKHGYSFKRWDLLLAEYAISQIVFLSFSNLGIIFIFFIDFLIVLDPPTCQGDLPCKKSQLDLKLFGVGVPAVGHKVMPWPWCRIKESTKALSVERVWLMQWVKEAVWEVPTLRRGEGGEGEFQVEMDQSQLD